MTSKTENTLYDWELYGLLLRKRRIDMGFKKAEDFASTIWRRTRVKLTRDMLYKFEQGRQVPDGTQFMALNLVVSGNLFAPDISNLCSTLETQALSEDRIPQEWKTENAQSVWRSFTGCENPNDLTFKIPATELYFLLTRSSFELVADDPSLFDSRVDDAWHSAIESCFIEAYGPDPTEWPLPEE